MSMDTSMPSGASPTQGTPAKAPTTDASRAPQKLELVLAKQANGAIAQGNDPKRVSELLSASIRYARSNPELTAQAERALAAGFDPTAVANKFGQAFLDDPVAASALKAEQRHQQYASGTLQRGVGRVNAAEMGQATDTTGDPSYRERLGGAAANLMRDIPGATAGTAGLSALLKGQSYPEAYAGIKAAEDVTPDNLRKALRVTGGTAAMLAMPGSPAMQGARYGLTSEMLQANPDVNLDQRLKKGVGAGLLGLGLGKGAELAGTGLRAYFAPQAGEAAVKIAGERAAAAGPEYNAFRALGDLPTTPKLAQSLDEPMVQRAIRTIRRENKALYGAMNDTDPVLLDEVYKRMGNNAFQAKYGFVPEQTVSALGDAIEEAAQTKGGSYAKALEAFRTPSRVMEAGKLGEQGLNYAKGKGLTSLESDVTMSPSALKEWAAQPGRTPAEIKAAAQGVLSAVRREGALGIARTAHGTLQLPWAGLRAAPQVLESIGQRATPTQSVLQALGLEHFIPGGR